MDGLVIFSTDKQGDLRSLAKATHFLDVIAAMRLDASTIFPIWGMYKGVPELSFGCSPHTWETYIKDSDHVQGQESILILSGDENGYLKYLKTGKVVHLGKFKVVDTVEGLDSWSYCEGVGYWVLE